MPKRHARLWFEPYKWEVRLWAWVLVDVAFSVVAIVLHEVVWLVPAGMAVLGILFSVVKLADEELGSKCTCALCRRGVDS